MGEHALTPEERPLAFTYKSSRDEAVHLLVASLKQVCVGDVVADTGDPDLAVAPAHAAQLDAGDGVLMLAALPFVCPCPPRRAGRKPCS